jgi:hypothetical protein
MPSLIRKRQIMLQVLRYTLRYTCMKYLVAAGLLATSTAFAGDERPHTYACGANTLVVTSTGFEHVNHQVSLNKAKRIKELEDANWFVETVTCKQGSFNIVASHVQYNEPTKRTFKLKVTRSGYEIK